jgi:hypothetical protein
MREGGPDNAMRVCQEVAPAIAQEVSSDRGMDVKRVSLRNRNPDMGEPSDWEADVLRAFDRRHGEGEPAAGMTWSATVDGEYRFMQAIPTDAVCLNCHGSNLSAEVRETLDELYPADEATGYEEGDVRGAFVVTKAL